MHLPVPDPAYTHSALARAHFRLSARLALGFVALIWLVYLLNAAFDVDPGPFGVRPRESAGLVGIFFAPLVHNGFAHIAANTLPLAVLGTAMLFLYPNSSLRALPVIYLAPGVVVWLFGRGSVHLGASGLIYGQVAFIFIAGLLRRDRRAIAASLVVAFM
jgi:membrane associated rhomboid family serine protease